MKRLLVLLVFACFAVAQVNDADSPGAAAAAADDSFLDDIIGTEQTQPVKQPEASTLSATDAGTAAEVSSPESDMPAQADSPAPEQRSDVAPPSGPDLDESVRTPVSASGTTRGDDRSGSTPLIDEKVVQERPDIPEFSHKKHIEDVGAECVQCHQTLFSVSVRGIKTGPSMKEICSQCHDGSVAPAEVLVGFTDEKKYVKTWLPLFSHEKHTVHTEDCRVCHRDIYGDLKKIKTPPPMTLCNECHNNNKADASCRNCHEDPSRLKPKSHNARWLYRYGHGTEARYVQTECRACHADRECYTCHRGQSSFAVHRPGYKFTHGMDARQREVNCTHCHETAGSCVRCHERTR